MLIITGVVNLAFPRVMNNLFGRRFNRKGDGYPVIIKDVSVSNVYTKEGENDIAGSCRV